LEIGRRRELVRDHDLVGESLLFRVVFPFDVSSPSFALFGKLLVVVNVGNVWMPFFRVMDILVGALNV